MATSCLLPLDPFLFEDRGRKEAGVTERHKSLYYGAEVFVLVLKDMLKLVMFWSLSEASKASSKVGNFGIKFHICFFLLSTKNKKRKFRTKKDPTRRFSIDSSADKLSKTFFHWRTAADFDLD